MILPVKRNADGKQMFLALQSVPFGPNRTNVGIYYKALESINDYQTPEVFARDWTGKKQISHIGSAYSTMVWQKDNRLGFLYEEETYGASYTNVYKAMTLEQITDNAFSYDPTVPRPTKTADPILQTDLGTAHYLLGFKGVGYPKADAESRTRLQSIYQTPAKYNKNQLYAAIRKYVNDANVELPEDGMLYTLKFVSKDKQAFLLDYTDGKIATRQLTTDETPGASAKFKAHVLPNGKLAFETMDGKYLSYPTKTPAPSWLTNFSTSGVTDGLDEDANALDLQKAAEGSHIESSGILDLFGNFFIHSKRGNSTDNQQKVMGYWVMNTQDNTFDGAGDPFLTDKFTSMLRIEYKGKPTGIQQVDGDAAKDTGAIYNLSGQRMDTDRLSELKPGVYIVNGRKMVVR